MTVVHKPFKITQCLSTVNYNIVSLHLLEATDRINRMYRFTIEAKQNPALLGDMPEPIIFDAETREAKFTEKGVKLTLGISLDSFMKIARYQEVFAKGGDEALCMISYEVIAREPQEKPKASDSEDDSDEDDLLD